MLIGINGNEANVKTRVGIGQYSFGLLSQLSKYKSDDLRFRIYLRSDPMADLPKPTDKWQYKIVRPAKLWMLTGLQRQIIREKLNGTVPDVFFTSTHYSPLYMPIPTVLSIMDLAHEKFPEYFKKKDYLQLKYWTAASVMIASRILTISEHTKKDICSLYAVSPDKVVVTYPGYDTKRFNAKVKSQKSKIKNTIQKYKVKEPYLLFLGTLQPRKNLIRLIEAFHQLKNYNLQLVIAGMINEGRGGWMYEEIFEEVKKLGMEARVKFTGYVPDEDVPYLMAGAKAYVLPSLYEGFGIPPIEAMATGVPVIVSKTSSLPEICGEAAIYIDKTYDTESIRQTLENTLKMSSNELDSRVSLGLKWVKRYNWETTAKLTLETLTDAVGKNAIKNV